MIDFLTDHFFAMMFYTIAGLLFARYAIPGAIGLVAPSTRRKPPIERERAKLLKLIDKSERKIASAKHLREYSGDPQLMLRAQRDIRHHERMLTLYRVQLRQVSPEDAPSKPTYVSKPREPKEVTHARSLGKRNMIDAWRNWAGSETPSERAAREAVEKRAAEQRAAREAADHEKRVDAYAEKHGCERQAAIDAIKEIDKKHEYMRSEQYRRRYHPGGIGGFGSYDEYAAYMDGRSGSDTATERREARERTEAARIVEHPPVSDWNIEQLRDWAVSAISRREEIVKHYDLGTWEKHLDYCCALITDRRDESFDTKTGLTSTKLLRHEDTAVRDAYIAGGISGAEHIADAISRSRQLVRTDQQTAHAVDEVSRRMNAAIAALKETHKPTEERAEHEDWKSEFESIARPEITAGPEPEQKETD